jgi:hypothetical protein
MFIPLVVRFAKKVPLIFQWSRNGTLRGSVIRRSSSPKIGVSLPLNAGLGITPPISDKGPTPDG